MNTLIKILKYLGIGIAVIAVALVAYVYSLTFTPHGRLDWGQAIFLKMAGNRDGQIDAIKKMTIEQRSHTFDAMSLDTEGLDIDTLKITPDSLKTYIFKPQNLTKSSHVIVYFHGGGFTLPWMNLSAYASIRLAKAFNAIVVGVDYRVAPEYPFPNANNDCYATLLWTIANISKSGGNPNQLIVAGESAGATLAALVVLKAKKEKITNIKYQLLNCPVTYVPMETEGYQKLKHGYFLEERDMIYSLESFLPNKEDYKNPSALPYYADSLANLPPAYIITCEFDPIKDTGRAYALKLKDANVPTIHREMKGMLHTMPGPFNEKDRNELYAEIAKEAKKVINN